MGLLAGVYGGLVKLKNTAYEKALLDTYELPVPVVSLGNLSVGGTGKTPLTLALAKEFSKSYRRIAIITRSYKTPLRFPMQVSLGVGPGPNVVGDEAYFLAERAAAVVFSGPDKTETARFAFESLRPDLILIDDGFQHRKLQRDLDYVLWDATENREKLLPEGRLREGFDSLSRADGLFLTKTNLVSEQRLEQLRRRFQAMNVCEVKFHLDPGSSFWAESFGCPVAVLSGVAHNSIFQRQVEAGLGRPVDQVFAFQDHHVYRESDLIPAKDFLKKHPGAWLVTTEKDAVKLQAWMKTEKRVRSLALQLEFDGALASFVHQVDDLKKDHKLPYAGPVPEWPL